MLPPDVSLPWLLFIAYYCQHHGFERAFSTYKHFLPRTSSKNFNPFVSQMRSVTPRPRYSSISAVVELFFLTGAWSGTADVLVKKSQFY